MGQEGDPPRPERAIISTGVPARVNVGFNYPWSYENYGNQIGPNPMLDPWPTEYERQKKLAESGKYKPPDIPLPSLFTHLKRNLTNLKAMGFKVVRWFLMGNFYTYGLGGDSRSHAGVPPGFEIWDFEFDPPKTPDPRYKYHFEELLKVFKEVGMLFMPSFVDFGIARNYDGSWNAKNTRVGGRRADCITDPKKRDNLLAFMQELVDVAAKKDYADIILAWDVCNEPFWLSFPIFGQMTPPPFVVHREGNLPFFHFGVMNEKVVIEFLEKALAIVKGRLKSTVGHRFYRDLSVYPTGDIPHFHYYAKNWHVYVPGRGPVDVADPQFIPKMTPDKRAILGEFAVKQSSHPKWPEPDGDVPSFKDTSTFARLKLLEDKGYTLVMVWNQQVLRQKFKKDGTPILDSKGNPQYKAEDWVKLTDDVRRDIVSYTGGTFVPLEAPDPKDAEEL